ncbi:MAG: aminopeptidase [Candidatus Heimdallarchaeota archaeon]
MKSIEDIFRSNLIQCANLQPDEAVLVISDLSQDEKIPLSVAKAAESLGGKTILVIPHTDLLVEKRLPDALQQFMNHSNLIVICNSKLFPHSSRVKAMDEGARILSMSRADISMIQRCFDLDYDKLSKLTKEVAKRFSEAKEVEIKSSAGTDMVFSLKGMKAMYFDGLCRDNGILTSLPSGVVAIPLQEGCAEGKWIINGSIQSIGLIDPPITVEVTDGIGNILGNSEQAEQFRKILSAGDENSFRVCEVGCGTNAKATYIGDLIEDERVAGSGHIGFGGNTHFGGTIQSTTHIDSSTRNPTISLDGDPIIKNGNLLI